MGDRVKKSEADTEIFDDDIKFLEGYKDQYAGYYVEFFDLVGSLSVAVFLTQCFYWQKKMFKKTGDPEYWWWKPQESWHEDTRLSKKQQRAARKKLGSDEAEKGLGLISEERRGRDGNLHFRLNTQRLRTLVKDRRDVLGSDLREPRRCPKGTSLPSSSSVSTSVRKGPSEARSPLASRCDEAGDETRDEKRQDLGNTRVLPADPSVREDKTYDGASEKRARIRRKAAQKAAEKDVKASGALGRLSAGSLSGGARRGRGGVSSRQARNRREPDGFERAQREADDDRRRHDPIRRGLSKRKALPEPADGAAFADLEVWACEQVRLPNRHGGGIKAPSEWVGGDLDGYLIALATKALPEHASPSSSGKSRGQAKNLILSVGASEARELVAYCVSNWDHVTQQLKLDGLSGPSCGFILGFLESVKALQAGKTRKKHRETGADRVATKADYDAGPSEGWG